MLSIDIYQFTFLFNYHVFMIEHKIGFDTTQSTNMDEFYNNIIHNGTFFFLMKVLYLFFMVDCYFSFNFVLHHINIDWNFHEKIFKLGFDDVSTIIDIILLVFLLF
jgi:hypothetical protein